MRSCASIPRRARCSASRCRQGRRQPQHGDLRQGRAAVVHRPGRLCTAGSTRRAARSRLARRRAARGPYGITTTPAGEVYYASLAGSHIARIDPATAKATPIEPPTREQGARRVWTRFEGPHLGQRMVRGPGRRLRSARGRRGAGLARLEAARRGAARLRRLRRRARRRLAHRLRGQRHRALRSAVRTLRELPEHGARRRGAPAARPRRRGLGRGIGRGPAGRDQALK